MRMHGPVQFASRLDFWVFRFFSSLSTEQYFFVDLCTSPRSSLPFSFFLFSWSWLCCLSRCAAFPGLLFFYVPSFIIQRFLGECVFFFWKHIQIQSKERWGGIESEKRKGIGSSRKEEVCSFFYYRREDTVRQTRLNRLSSSTCIC